MRSFFVAVALLAMLLLGSETVNAQQTEQDIIDRYMKKADELHVTKLGWASVSFAGNRVNRQASFKMPSLQLARWVMIYGR